MLLEIGLLKTTKKTKQIMITIIIIIIKFIYACMYATGSHQGNLIVTQCREQEGKPLFSQDSNVLHFQTFPLCLTCFDAGNIFK